MKILDGKKIAEKMFSDLKRKVKKAERRPFLAVILVGEDEASRIYVNLKEKMAERVGIGFELHKFKSDVSQDTIVDLISRLNSDNKVSGIIVQLPLPEKLDKQEIIDSIDPRKDVDGFSAKSDKSGLDPVFPKAIMKLLESSEQDFENKKAIVVANSKLFGRMMEKVLRKKKIESEYLLKPDIGKFSSKIKSADIIITAIGSKGIITGEMIKPGAIIIDGGIVKVGKKVFGDVDLGSVRDKSGFITPVPGGVGPVTITCLLENVYLASKQ